MQPAHDKLSKAFKSEVDSMMASKGVRVMRDPKQGMRVLRSRQHSINLTGSKEFNAFNTY